jgi:hypothetical protein
MEAGRELDAIIAEKVMGWQRETDERELRRLNSGYLDASEYARWWINPSGGWACASPRYSTDIAAAWEVVERLKDANRDDASYDFDLIYESSKERETGLRNDVFGWFAQFGEAEHGSGRADTAPLAICLAALEAVGK